MTAIPLVADCGRAASRLVSFKNLGNNPAMANIKSGVKGLERVMDGVGDVAVERAA